MRKYRILWKKGNTTRYYIEGTGIEVQVGKYRELDSYEKSIKLKPTWQGKWYVDVFGGQQYLFNTEKQARTKFKQVVNNIHKNKQLR